MRQPAERSNSEAISPSIASASAPCASPAKAFGASRKIPTKRAGFCAARLNLASISSTTADSYGPEVSERLIAEALHPYPKGLVIATKGGFTRSGPDAWAIVGRPEYLRQCVELSLRRLRVDRIDLYQLHRIDPQVPAEDSLGALKDLQKAGKIRHIGCRRFPSRKSSKPARWSTS